MATNWCSTIEKMPGARCLGHYGDWWTMVKATSETQPHIAILGLAAQQDGQRTIQEIQSAIPDAQVLVIAAELKDDQLFATLRAGVSGFLQQDLFPTHLQQAIRELYQGGTPLSKQAAKRIMASFRAQRRSDNLSEREQEVYQQLCAGKNYREIAEALYVSQNTVRFHLKNIYKKLGVKSRHEAMAYAYQASRHT